MGKNKFGLSLNPRTNQVHILLNSRREREELLLLLNKVELNASISLYEKREEENAKSNAN